MKFDRRKFLSLAGVTAALGLGGKATFELLASGEANKAAQTKGGSTWAMAVDLTRCFQLEGCHACMDACNAQHNVPHIENARHEIKWIWKEEYHYAFIEQENERLPENLLSKQVPLLCNHCDNPPCVSVCPTKATWKREDGIVMMDWHRCIGCRYCIAACPYGSRSFNWTDPREHLASLNPEFPTRMRGVVEKCTFCAERLAKGEQPACVETCPVHAMMFGDINDKNSEVSKALTKRFSLRRKAELGTKPEVYYLL